MLMCSGAVTAHWGSHYSNATMQCHGIEILQVETYIHRTYAHAHMSTAYLILTTSASIILMVNGAPAILFCVRSCSTLHEKHAHKSQIDHVRPPQVCSFSRQT